MCTATWLWDDEGYWLLFNRDERRSRGRAQPPTRFERDGLSYLAPRDGDAGGTWLAVNETGLCVALLNYYDAPAEAKAPSISFTSRGLLVSSLARMSRLVELERGLAALVMHRYRPFTLLALTPREAALFEWTGSSLRRLPEPTPRLLSSSGHDAPTAYRLRQEELATIEPNSLPALRQFHRSHQPERGPFSPCMHRADASTVSFSVVRVGRQRVSIEYADGPPCSTEPERAVELERRRPVGVVSG